MKMNTGINFRTTVPILITALVLAVCVLQCATEISFNPVQEQQGTP